MLRSSEERVSHFRISPSVSLPCWRCSGFATSSIMSLSIFTRLMSQYFVLTEATDQENRQRLDWLSQKAKMGVGSDSLDGKVICDKVGDPAWT